MCARLGLVTGRGLAGVMRRRYSPWVLWGACTILVVANVINIAADLGGMAEATQMVTGVPSALMVPVYGVVIVGCCLVVVPLDRAGLQVADARAPRLRPHRIRRRVDWRLALQATFIPHIEWSRRSSRCSWRFWAPPSRRTCSSGRPRRKSKKSARWAGPGERRGATREELNACAPTSLTGMFASNVDHVFHHPDDGSHAARPRQDEIATAREAAEALRPLAGAGAYWLFTLGLIGTGCSPSL